MCKWFHHGWMWVWNLSETGLGDVLTFCDWWIGVLLMCVLSYRIKGYHYLSKWSKNKFNKIKDPSLKELYYHAFNMEIENAHNSKYDVINLQEAIKKITGGNLNNYL